MILGNLNNNNNNNNVYKYMWMLHKYSEKHSSLFWHEERYGQKEI